VIILAQPLGEQLEEDESQTRNNSNTTTQVDRVNMVSSESGGTNPWAWLGLMKWTLEYTDGTQPSSPDQVPMSAEDRAFLEKVMKEGIIDENERMKTILKEVTAQMESWRTREEFTQEEADNVEDLLQELRDIVEQIDYARAFQAMSGLSFLLGCIQRGDSLPRTTRLMCLGLLATLCQHNPPVQKELLDMGSIRILSDLFFATPPEEDPDGQMRAKTIQAMSANVRSHALAESVFSEVEQAPQLLAQGLAQEAPTVLRKRTLFFLQALVTSDAATKERVRLFAAPIVNAIDQNLVFLDYEKATSGDLELVEMTLAMVEQILEQKKSVNVVLTRRDPVVAVAVKRVAAIRELTGDDREFATVELGLWESTLRLLARGTEDEN